MMYSQIYNIQMRLRKEKLSTKIIPTHRHDTLMEQRKKRPQRELPLIYHFIPEHRERVELPTSRNGTAKNQRQQKRQQQKLKKKATPRSPALEHGSEILCQVSPAPAIM